MSVKSSARSTARSGVSGKSTSRSQVSFAESEEEIDLDAEWREGPERCLFIVKPDALEQFDGEIKEELDAVLLTSGAELVEYKKVQISRPNADRFALLFEESEERERIRAIKEEEARLQLEAAEAALNSARSSATGSSPRSSKGGASSRKSTARSMATSARSSRKSTSRTARAARVAEEEAALAAKTEERDALAAFLCSGMIAIALIEGEGCVEAIKTLAGPADPESWKDEDGQPIGDSLRVKFGEDKLRNVVDVSMSEVAGRKEAAFVDELLEELARMDALMRGGKKPPAKKSEWVSLDAILNFCFPEGEWHPASTGRLAVLGSYGPLASDGNLRCGIQGDHIVSDVELKAMIEEMQREDILRVYIGNERLQREEQEEILIQADEELQKVPQKTPEQIRNMFKRLKTNAKGDYSFHDLQRVIMKERDKRVKNLMYMPCDRANLRLVKLLKKALKAEREGTVKKKKKWKASLPAPTPKVADQDAYRVNAIMLNRNTFRITEVNRGNIAGLTTNVKLLLPNRNTAKGSSNWNTTCCLSKTNKSHYVNKYNKVTENDKYK
jgi:nucleoside diphosphate kinase